MIKMKIYEGLYPSGLPKYIVTDDGRVHKGVYSTGNVVACVDEDGIIYEGYYKGNVIGRIRNGKIYSDYYGTGQPKYNTNGENIFSGYYQSEPLYCVERVGEDDLEEKKMASGFMIGSGYLHDILNSKREPTDADRMCENASDSFLSLL